MRKLIVSIGLMSLMASSAQANEIQLYNPVITVKEIRLSDYAIDHPPNKETAVLFIIEFSASSDLRKWAKDVGGLIMPKYLSCKQDEDDDGLYEPIFIWDFKGVLASEGRIVDYPNQPREKSGRYRTVLFPEGKSINSDMRELSQGATSSAGSTPNLENITENLCMRVGFYNTMGLLAHPWSKPVVIEPSQFRSAWEKFKKQQ